MEINDETSNSPQISNYFAGQSSISDDYLKHFLSPILVAANQARFEPFTYNFTGYELRIGKEIASELRKISVAHLATCKALITQIADLLLETNGEHTEFLSTPIKDVNFSVRTYHGLKGSGCCETMLDVAKLGSRGVLQLRLIGKKSQEEIRQVFIKAGCVELFETKSHEEK